MKKSSTKKIKPAVKLVVKNTKTTKKVKANQIPSRRKAKISRRQSGTRRLLKNTGFLVKSKPTKVKKVLSKLSRLEADSLALFNDDHVTVFKDLQKNNFDQKLKLDSAADIVKSTSSTTEIAGQNELIVDTQPNEIGAKILSVRQPAQKISSPHVVDLKTRVVYEDNNYQTVAPLTAATWEERIYAWDKKMQNIKTNFITSDLRQQQIYKSNQNKKVGFFSRMIRRFSGWLSAGYFSMVNSFSNWGETQTEKILQTAATADTDDFVDQVRPVKKRLSLWPQELAVSMRLFIILAVILVLPFQVYNFYSDVKTQQEMVLGASSTVYNDFQAGFQAFENLDFSQASDRFISAQLNLRQVNDWVQKYPSFLFMLAKFIPGAGGEVSSGLNLMAAGDKMAQLGVMLSDLFTDLQANSGDNLAALQSLESGLNQAAVIMQEIELILQKIDLTKLPANYQEQFSQLNEILPIARQVLQNASLASGFSADFLGREQPMRYLLVFQNSNELRPTGGFIGSIAEVDIKDARVQNFYLPPGGVYDLQGNLEVLLAAPEPLRLLNANWQLQDANWFFDWPTSAKKIMWFYEKSGGPTVDGVIAVNSQLLPKLLQLTGPIYLAEFDQILTAENVIDQLQYEVEINYDRSLNQPKKIISQLMPILLDRLQKLPPTDFFSLFSVVHNSLQAKEIQLYHTNSMLQKKIDTFGFAGQIQPTNRDYLAVVDTNIGGGKTDQVIGSQVLLTSQIGPLGDVVNTLKIIKRHDGDPTDQFTGQMYRDYLRIYVPQGSRLLSAKGFTPPAPTEYNQPASGFQRDDYLAQVENNERFDLTTGTRITDEYDKTVFGNWLTLNPGELVEIEIVYALPKNITFKKQNDGNFIVGLIDQLLSKLNLSFSAEREVAMHTLFLQKQSGQPPYNFSQEIIFPSSWEVQTSELLKNTTAQRDNRVYYQNLIKADSLWGLIFIR